MKRPPLRYFRTKNFKAIRDSGRVEFGWLTAFIGDNGSGKSSLIEAMETFRDVVVDGVDSAFRRWRGFEHVWNKSRKRIAIEDSVQRTRYSSSMQFEMRWRSVDRPSYCRQSITQGLRGSSVFIAKERWVQLEGKDIVTWTRDLSGHVEVYFNHAMISQHIDGFDKKLDDGVSAIKQSSRASLNRWQFLSLNPDRIGHPSPEQLATQKVRLARDGSNVAAYLNEIRELDTTVFDGILDALRFVLPYVHDVQPTFTSEIERSYYLKMKEQDFDVPGWLLSTGTLRVLALLAVLRHPDPPPLLVIEELENGLDPRTLNMIVEEIRSATMSGRTQVIVTTHSPYLLDLLDLSHIVIVERKDGETIFRRPDERGLAEWSKSFSPGRLYTMGRLTGDES